MINWLLNFDLNDNANQAILNVSARQHYYSSTVKERSGGRNGISTNTGSLYLYNQSEFYFNTPKVIRVMCIPDHFDRSIKL